MAKKTAKKAVKQGEPQELRTELKRVNQELKLTKDLVKVISRGKYQWQATFDAISDPVMIVTKDYKIVRANTSLAKISGVDIRKIIGKKCFEVFAGRKIACAGCPVPAASESESPISQRLENEIKRRDYIAHAFPFVDLVDETESFVVHYRDITEEKRLQQEVIQQEKMVAIGMLAGGVAHEINNPLGGIIAFAQLLKRDLGESNQYYGDVEEIESAALRCKKIVQDLLDFSRMSSGKKKHWLDINPLIEKVIPFIKMELRSLNIKLENNLQRDLPQIYGDANRLQQVFLNLLTNACHAMEKGGCLKISTFADSGKQSVCVRIEDTGCGIGREDMGYIFDPFFTTKRPGKGTGLGLSISYRIIRDHGGVIEVESKLEKGTIFTIYLPLVREGADESEGG